MVRCFPLSRGPPTRFETPRTPPQATRLSSTSSMGSAANPKAEARRRLRTDPLLRTARQSDSGAKDRALSCVALGPRPRAPTAQKGTRSREASSAHGHRHPLLPRMSPRPHGGRGRNRPTASDPFASSACQDQRFVMTHTVDRPRLRASIARPRVAAERNRCASRLDRSRKTALCRARSRRSPDLYAPGIDPNRRGSLLPALARPPDAIRNPKDAPPSHAA